MPELTFYIGMLIFCSISLGICLGFLFFRVIDWDAVGEWLKAQVTAK